MTLDKNRRDAKSAEVALRMQNMRAQPARVVINPITQDVIGAAIAVHRVLGPGLLESAYQECLCQELFLRGIPFERQVPLPLEYRGIRLEGGYRVDILVAGLVVIEVKSVEAIGRQSMKHS